MNKIYCVTCCIYRKLEKPKISFIFEETLVIFIICSQCKNEDEKIFAGEESIEILKIFGLIENIYLVLPYSGVWAKIPPPYQFFLVTSTKIRISLQNFLTFSLNLFTITVSSFKVCLVPVSNYWA